MKKQKIDPIRSTSLQIVKKTLNGQDLQAVLNQALNQLENQQDKALLTELCYGYFRYKRQLEYLLKTLFLPKWNKLPLDIKIVLGLSCYELYYLSKIPAYATLSWSVNLIKNKYKAKLGGLVNAVLRKCTQIDLTDTIFKQDNPSLATFLSRKYSMPFWIVELLLKEQNKTDVENFLKSSLKRPPTSLLLLKPITIPKELKPGILQETPCGFSIKPKWEEKIFSFFKKNNIPYYPQSLASQQILLKLISQIKEPIWDACAGSGGKSFVLYRLGFKPFASDINLKRLLFLKQQLHVWNLKPKIFRADAKQPPFKKVTTILLDAPCSGLGVLARRPDIKWKRSLKDIKQLSAIQQKILSNTFQVLPKGGVLLYLTCTVTKKENEEQVNFLLEKYSSKVKVECIIKPNFQTEKEYFFGAKFIKIGN
ncbi:transcription antitermination factor NusB [Desulfonauticus submarinus]